MNLKFRPPSDPVDGGSVSTAPRPGTGHVMSTQEPGRRGTTIPGYLAALLTAVAIAALPLVAQLVDNSADEFSPHSFAVWPALGWVTCAALSAVVVTRRLQTQVAIEEGSALALAYDALPVLLAIPWVIGVLSAITGHWLLMTAASGLCAYHVILLAPRLMKAPTPSWVRRAPLLRLVVANVFVDNRTPADAARQLVESGGDVLVIVESTATFMSVFDESGGADAYPHRVADPDDESDYAVSIVSNREFGPRSEFRHIGPLRLAIADVDVDGTSTLVVALNPMATMDLDGHVTWKEQIRVLAEFVPTLSGPVVIAGDLNTTRYRPEFEQIMKLGYSDAIDSLGKGLNPSFKLTAGGALGAVGAVVRLDHALVNDDMHAVAMRNLEARGSDHIPFVVDLAVRLRQPRKPGLHGIHQREPIAEDRDVASDQ